MRTSKYIQFRHVLFLEQALQALDGNADTSMSGDDAMLLESDIDDPIHDDDILDELFYKHVCMLTKNCDFCITV